MIVAFYDLYLPKTYGEVFAPRHHAHQEAPRFSCSSRHLTLCAHCLCDTGNRSSGTRSIHRSTPSIRSFRKLMTVFSGLEPRVFFSRIARAKSSTISRVLLVVIGVMQLQSPATLPTRIRNRNCKRWDLSSPKAHAAGHSNQRQASVVNS